MLVGDQGSFAIESGITQLLPGQPRGLGWFVVHVGGKRYGVRKPSATLLDCSFDEVNNRVWRRGTHQVPFLSDVRAPAIVDAFLDALYRDTKRDRYFDLTASEFGDCIHNSKIQWAPDGDQAFDDGSYILQFDIGSKVRLIAFQNLESPEDTANSIAEQWLEGDAFYGLLSEWSERFAAEAARGVLPA
ncbi:Imm42 family immunity protein [Sphingomonas sp. KR3-1]|uniref:Imm42 family immunity protein n=1 Tax=Sphingomonas sp. KR3-1 TaxID=3156611 RepID=UPI0032B32D05